MSETVLAALIGAVGLVLSGILVELIRTRRRADVTAAELKPNHGSSLRDAVDRIEAQVQQVTTDVQAVTTEQRTQGDRLIVVETRLTDHLNVKAQQ